VVPIGLVYSIYDSEEEEAIKKEMIDASERMITLGSGGSVEV
jgi:hypothetical protein